ncbi:MAG: NAD(P)/FAD-dependent oxidoreductase [Solirubrobacterales bacterium]
MKVAVIGAGITGLVAARRLSKEGHWVDVYERWPGLGGQVATLALGDGHRLEHYYHHLFTSDRDIEALYRELDMPDAIEWLPSSVAIFAEGRSHPFTSPMDLLRFSPLPFRSRLRMGIAAVALQRLYRTVDPFESVTAHEWIRSRMGRNAWDRVWGPMLRGKFGDRAEDISMAWIWSKLNLRRPIKGSEVRHEMLGYPRGGWQPLLDRLSAEVEAAGGRVLIDHPAARIGIDGERLVVTGGAQNSFRRGHDPRQFDEADGSRPYDAVVATVPNDIFEQLLTPEVLEGLGCAFLSRIRSIEYHAAVCLLLELDRPLSRFYWTNVADRTLPFVGLIDQTNLVGASRYGGRHFLYVANYVPRGDPLLELGPDELLARYEPGLTKVNPAFSRDWIRMRLLFREPAAQPIVAVGYRGRIPPMQTPMPGLYLANTTQIYPEDRGTNYGVRLGEQVARLLLEAGPTKSPS